MPDWTPAIHERLRGLALDPAREAELIDDLSRHLDHRFRELLDSGVPQADAIRAAVAELETLPMPPRPLRLAGSLAGEPDANFAGSVWHDFKVAGRMLRSKPAFGAAVVFLLAVGIAGNAAIFSIFNGLFLRPLPFPQPDRLVDLDETAPKWNLARVSISNVDYDAWQRGNSAFEGMAFCDTNDANLSDPATGAQRVDTALVTWNFLSVLGLKPALGRDFLPEEDRPKGPAVAMLGYDLWQRLFHGDPAVIGRSIRFNDRPTAIIGILPREAVIPPRAQVWFPLQADTTQAGSYYLDGIGRLKPGVTPRQAEADLRRVHFSRKGYEQAEAYPIVGPVRDRFVGNFRYATNILLGAVGMVLLIVCVNIAGLMLVRGESRSREIAIRAAMGASRGRLVGQLLTESFLLATIGGVIGAGLGKLFLLGLVSLMPGDLPPWVQFTLDFRFALFCAAATGAAAILFGLAPALQASAVDTRGALQDASRSSLSRGRRRALGALVAGEIALALVLLVSSGLLVQAFVKVLHTDPGFRSDNLITWSLHLAGPRYAQNDQQYALFHEVAERLRTLPGVSAASAASIIPLNGHTGYFFEAENGRKIGAAEKNPVVLRITALAGYFEAMGFQLRAGRAFDARDEQPNAPRVLIVNETFARHFWGTIDVIGKRARYIGRNSDWRPIVGVVRDMRHYGVDQEVRPEAFLPFPSGARNAMTFVVRSRTDPRGLVAPARSLIAALDPDLPMYDVRTMADRLERSLWTRRAYSWLFAAFALVAILLAAAGIYGVISFSVSRRTREIGIRIALGASPSQVMRGVLAGGMGLVALGALIGVAGALFTGRLLNTLLFGVSTHDLATYGIVIAGIAGIGLLANFIPARRASRVEPTRALRAE